MLLAILLGMLPWPALGADSTPPPAPARASITALLDEEREFSSVPFSNVVHAVTGRRIVPLDLSANADRALLGKIDHAVREVVRAMNAPTSAGRHTRRINEVSAHFENALRDALNREPGFDCDFPKTAAGRIQRAGYPDLRLVDRVSGRVVYLDPKLYERGHRASTLRTFYFEPKRETNKILDDAHHLLVGIEHDGGAIGAWKFLRWDLVDLSRFEVRLKAEFQAANRDLYRPENIVSRGEADGRASQSPAKPAPR